MTVGKYMLVTVAWIVVFSCSSKSEFSHTPDSVSISLNDKAAAYIRQGTQGADSLRVLYYDSAIDILDVALLRDSLDVAAYTHKADALRKKGLPLESYAVLDQALTINPNLAGVAMMQGFIMEKKGRMDVAKKKYRDAVELFEENADKDPKNIKAQAEVVFALFFLDEKKANEELDNLIKKYPESGDVKAVAKIINDVGRKKYVEEVTKASIKVIGTSGEI